MKKLFIPLALALGCFGQGMAEGAVSATVIGDMEFVDMGLSLLWGKYDIGATSDEETGIYYAWGTVDNAGDYLSAVAGEYKMIPDGPCTAVQRDPADATKPYDIF
ncbi:MAG: hypothetical protein K2G21_04560 [Muribaculaceae bacterium]|nr:hypothetical protein [Muribaculaceae bacterium]